MTLLIIGLAVFMGIHLLPTFSPIRRTIFNQLGEGPYKGLYSLLSLTGFGLIVYGKAYAPYLEVWMPPEWTPMIVRIAMLPAMVLIVAANVPGNIKRFTPHPMMWAVLIWSSAHLTANGDQASIILFSAFAAFSIIMIMSANQRGASVQSDALGISSDIKVLLIGVVSYLIFAAAHPYLFKMAAF